jgi:hypothetical protein
MRLERENAQLRDELDRAREVARHAINDAERRGASGELVPLRQAVTVFRQGPSPFDDDRP